LGRQDGPDSQLFGGGFDLRVGRIGERRVKIAGTVKSGGFAARADLCMVAEKSWREAGASLCAEAESAFQYLAEQ